MGKQIWASPCGCLAASTVHAGEANSEADTYVESDVEDLRTPVQFRSPPLYDLMIHPRIQAVGKQFTSALRPPLVFLREVR